MLYLSIASWAVGMLAPDQKWWFLYSGTYRLRWLLFACPRSAHAKSIPSSARPYSEQSYHVNGLDLSFGIVSVLRVNADEYTNALPSSFSGFSLLSLMSDMVAILCPVMRCRSISQRQHHVRLHQVGGDVVWSCVDVVCASGRAFSRRRMESVCLRARDAKISRRIHCKEHPTQSIKPKFSISD